MARRSKATPHPPPILLPSRIPAIYLLQSDLLQRRHAPPRVVRYDNVMMPFVEAYVERDRSKGSKAFPANTARSVSHRPSSYHLPIPPSHPSFPSQRSHSCDSPYPLPHTPPPQLAAAALTAGHRPPIQPSDHPHPTHPTPLSLPGLCAFVKSLLLQPLLLLSSFAGWGDTVDASTVVLGDVVDSAEKVAVSVAVDDSAASVRQTL